MKTLARLTLLFLAAELVRSALPGTQAVELKSVRADLTGAVRAKDGAPLKDAAIFIFTAGPRVGPGFI